MANERANLKEGTSGVMDSYRLKVDRIIKVEKRLAKHRQEKQGSDKYQNILEKTFKYPLSSSKAERSLEVVMEYAYSILNRCALLCHIS